MKKSDSVFIAGHRGMVGSAIARVLNVLGYQNVMVADRAFLDLTKQSDVEEFFDVNRPEYVFLAAAKVGGILANATYPAEFIYDNLSIQTNVIDAAYRHGCKKLCFLGSSCIFPRACPQPMKEEHLLTGTLERTNEAYATAKIAGIQMCRAYRQQYGFNTIALQPTNLYGPYDNFHPTSSHVLPAMIRKFHDAKMSKAKEVVLWGTGQAMREFMHVDDLAQVAVLLMENHDNIDLVNVGTGSDISINDLAHMVAEVVGYEGRISFDPSKPDGTPRKLLDISKLRSLLKYWHQFPLKLGIEQTYRWYVKNETVDCDIHLSAL